MTTNRKPTAEEESGLTRRGFLSAGAGAVAAATLGAGTAAATIESSGTPEEMVAVTLQVNQRRHQLLVEPRWTLLFVLRERLGLTGTKVGCERGECGACTVLINNQPRYACMTLAVEAADTEITTIEGLLDGEQLSPLQQAFVEEDAMQCGYCTPGQVMAAEGLLRAKPDPSAEEIRNAMSGNLCRCGTYQHIVKAVQRAAVARGTGGGK